MCPAQTEDPGLSTAVSQQRSVGPGFTLRTDALGSRTPSAVINSVCVQGEQLVLSRLVPVRQAAWLQLLALSAVCKGRPDPALPAER